VRISSVVDQLASDLAALGALGDEAMATAANRLAHAMQGPFTARLLEVLSQAAAELAPVLGDDHVEVRLVGDDVQLVVFSGGPSPAAVAGPPPEPDDEPEARITLRLPAPLKARVEAASAREGLSVNAFIVRALSQEARAEPARGPRVGRRISGYGRS
jgi:HicB family